MRRVKTLIGLTAAVITVISLFGIQTDASGAVTKTAVPTQSTILIDETAAALQGYTIEENNYFKLRDIAMKLNGTAKQFEVAYNNSTSAITLTAGEAYTPNGGELILSDSSKSVSAAASSQKVYFGGERLILTAYTIDGYNYFRLRDIASCIDFGVNWDGIRNTVGISTATGYVLPDGAYKIYMTNARSESGERTLQFSLITQYNLKFNYLDSVKADAVKYYNYNYPVVEYNKDATTEIPIQDIIKRTDMTKNDLMAILEDFFPDNDLTCFLTIVCKQELSYRISEACFIKTYSYLCDSEDYGNGGYTILSPEELVERIQEELNQFDNLDPSNNAGVVIEIKNGVITSFKEQYAP